jgi:hypothetical protein
MTAAIYRGTKGVKLESGPMAFNRFRYSLVDPAPTASQRQQHPFPLLFHECGVKSSARPSVTKTSTTLNCAVSHRPPVGDAIDLCNNGGICDHGIGSDNLLREQTTPQPIPRAPAAALKNHWLIYDAAAPEVVDRHDQPSATVAVAEIELTRFRPSAAVPSFGMCPEPAPIKPDDLIQRARHRDRGLPLQDVSEHPTIGEASPLYSTNPHAAECIRYYSPRPKLIVIMRDPPSAHARSARTCYGSPAFTSQAPITPHQQPAKKATTVKRATAWRSSGSSVSGRAPPVSV